MTKYVHEKLANYIKSDAKKVKKSSPNCKNIPLTKISNALSTVFGYRHYHELKATNDKMTQNENFTEIGSLSYNELSNLTNSYVSFIRNNFNDNYNYRDNDYLSVNNFKYTMIKEINRGSNSITKIDMNSNFITFNFSNEEFKEFTTNYCMAKKRHSNKDWTNRILEFNELAFYVIKENKEKSYINAYKKLMKINGLLEARKTVSKKIAKRIDEYLYSFGCSSLNDVKDVKIIHKFQGYILTQLTSFINDAPFKENYPNDLKSISMTDLKLGSNNLHFKYQSITIIKEFMEGVIGFINNYDVNNGKMQKIDVLSQSIGCIIASNKTLEEKFATIKKYLTLRKNKNTEKVICVGFSNSEFELYKNINTSRTDSSLCFMWITNDEDNESAISFKTALKYDPYTIIINEPLKNEETRRMYLASYESGHLVLSLFKSNYCVNDFIELQGGYFCNSLECSFINNLLDT